MFKPKKKYNAASGGFDAEKPKPAKSSKTPPKKGFVPFGKK